MFWALKGGGGGSLGVVTAMEIGLFPVTEVYPGNLLYLPATPDNPAAIALVRRIARVVDVCFEGPELSIRAAIA